MPKGIYKPGKEVKLIIQDEKMDIYDEETDKIIASHKVFLEKGKLIKLDHPERRENKNLKTKELYKKALKFLRNTEDATLFISIIKKQKPRHLKDWLRLIINITALYKEAVIKKALKYCIERKLFSATMLKDTLEYLKVEKRRNLDKKYEKANILVPSKCQYIKPEIRDIKVYVNALKEDEIKWKN